MQKSIKINTPVNNDTLNLVLDTLKLNKQGLVFVNSKASAEKQAEDISKKVKDTICMDLAEDVLKGLSKHTKQCERLSKCIEKGIAFHHAGLTSRQKELIEDNFRLGKIKIICCTPTLAFGLDLPAYRVIIRDLKRFGNHGMQYIPILEYLQICGRAGRPGKETKGEAISVSTTESQKEELYNRYILGVPEDIYSKLAVEPVLRTYVLSLIATRFVKDKKELLDFFSKTFWAHQFKDMNKLEIVIDKMINLLEEFEFIKTASGKKDEFVSASDISDGKLTATLLGEKVAQLYIDPLTAHDIIEALKIATDVKSDEFAYAQLVCNCLELRPLLRVKVKEYGEIQEKLSKVYEKLLIDEPSLYEEDYDEYLNSIKTAWFMKDWMDEKDEDYLMKVYDIRPGEIKVKLDLADWLLYASEELARILHFQKILKDISKTRFRLKYGVKEELFPLLKLEGVGRVRARKLFNNNIKDIGALKKISIVTLSELLGKKIAENVKRAVGEDVTKLEVPAGRRKGQKSLNGFGKK